MNGEFFEVRCPNRIVNKKTGEKRKCNHLCLKAGAGSVGQVKCRYCGNIFDFMIDPKTKNQFSIRVKASDDKKETSAKQVTKNV